jgi:hypothetical protein
MSSTASGRFRRLTLTVLLVLAWYGLALQFYATIVTARTNGTSVSTAIVNYFSFFTILTNLLVALVLTVSLREPKSGGRNFFLTPGVQSSAAVSISIVGIVYSLVLRHLWDPEGLQKVADVLLHDVVPVVYVLYWLLFIPKDRLYFRDVPRWLAYPAIYLVYTLIRGAITARYPYHFLDAGEIGYPRVTINVVILLASFLGVSFVLLAIGRWIGGRTRV